MDQPGQRLLTAADKYGELGRDGKILFSVAATIHLNLFKIDKRRL
jgi:hypothetical protein